MSKIIFFAHTNRDDLYLSEYYKQDIDALSALGHKVIICTKYSEIPFDYDVMFIWWWTYALWPVLISRMLKKPCIITGTFNFRFPETFTGRDYLRRPYWQRFLINKATRLCTLNLFVNQNELNECSKYFELNNARYYPHVLSDDYLNGPSTQRTKSLFNLSWSGKGNLIRKGIPELLSAIRLLKDEGVEVHLNLAGIKGDGVDYILNMIEQLNIINEVSYLGSVSSTDKINLLRTCEMYIQPSHYEGFGLAIAEAMGCGACVITCDVGAVREVVGDCGLYVSAGSPEELAKAIKQVLHDDNLRHKLQISAQQRAKDYFSFDKKMARLENYFSEIGIKKVKVISTKKHQICTNCVMDTTDPKISFDANGVCDNCTRFYKDVKPYWDADQRDKAKLESLILKVKKTGKGKDFDCILGVSGGVDSSYMLHIAVKEFGLRPLVFHVDGGWDSELAVHNIEVMIEKLGLDLYTEVIDWAEMRDFQLAFFKSGVPHIDLPQDHAFIAALYNFANKYNIKYILNGGNISTEGIRNPYDWGYYGTDMAQINDIHSRFGTIPLKNYPLSPILKHKVYLRYIRGITVLKLLNYIPYNKKDAINLLSEMYGWREYPQKHFESRFTKFFEGYWLPVKFGYDTRKVQYSSLIVTGQMTRNEALERLKVSPYNPETIADEFKYVATKLNITEEELRSYMNAPNKTYKDYKNHATIFLLGAKTLKVFGVERSIKR